MEKVLITGVDGVVGGNLALALSDRFEVVGMYQHHEVELEGCLTQPGDPSCPEDIAELIEGFAPQWIVHCGHLSRSNWDNFEAERLHVDVAAASELAKATAEAAIGLCVVLTDAVFTGPHMFHEEHFPATAEGPAATAAREIERLLAPSAALVIRTHAYGWSPWPTEAGWAERCHDAMADGLFCEADAERHATPILATDLAELLVRARERRLSGLFHVCGAERTTPYRFAAEMAAACGFKGSQVRLVDTAADPRASLVRHETSLNARHARHGLGLPMPMLREGLSRFAAQAASGYREKLQGGALSSPGGPWLRASA